MLKFVFLILCGIECMRSELLLNKREGAACTWQDRNGTCVHIYRCWSAVENVKNRNFPPICSYKDKDPIICCTDCQLVNDTRNIILDPDVGIIVKSFKKSGDNCFNYLHKLDYPCKNTFNISNGYKLNETRNCNKFESKVTSVNATLYAASRKRISYLAYLGYGDNVDTADWLCWGSVISERFILTAAQCINSENSTGPVRFIALGIYQRWVSPSTWEHYNVKRAIPHPEYNPPSLYNDIALLETDKEITFGPHVLPACIFSSLNIISVGKNVNTLVWGQGDNGTSEYAQVTSFGEEECTFLYPPRETMKDGYNHTSQRCFGNKKKPTDTCDSEIGAPLIGVHKNCIDVIGGIASSKRTCGDSGGSGLFTRVSLYDTWIESIVWP